MHKENPNLRRLHDKVDSFFAQIVDKHGQHLSCRTGCSSCCQQTISLFPVELEPIREATRTLPEEQKERLADRLGSPISAQSPDERPCPLLEDERCLVYEARPIICRTHGLPVLVERTESGPPERDVCPLNFTEGLDIEQLPAEELLDVRRLDQVLALTNHLAMQEAASDAQREPIDHALRRWLAEA